MDSNSIVANATRWVSYPNDIFIVIFEFSFGTGLFGERFFPLLSTYINVEVTGIERAANKTAKNYHFFFFLLELTSRRIIAISRDVTR